MGQLKLGADDVFILEAKFGSRRDGAEIRCRHGYATLGESARGISTAQQMSVIDDR